MLSGRCAELGDAVPYLPLADALSDATSGPSPDGALLDALAARPVLSRLLPDRGASPASLRTCRAWCSSSCSAPCSGCSPSWPRASPVLLMLEDLHWADRSTRDLLTFLSRVLHSERLAVVATYRSDDMHRRHPLRPLVAELLRLPGVDLVELGPLARVRHGRASDRPVQAAARRGGRGQMITRAEGNAYYAEELLAPRPRPGPSCPPASLICCWPGWSGCRPTPSRC